MVFSDSMFPSVSIKELGLFRKALHGRKVVFWFGFDLFVCFPPTLSCYFQTSLQFILE